jgi:hypothetical protein
MRIDKARKQSLSGAINLMIYARLRALTDELDLAIFNDDSGVMQNA